MREPRLIFLLLVLILPAWADSAEPKVYELKGVNGNVISAQIKEVKDTSVYIKVGSKNMWVNWDKFDETHHQLFQDIQQYHKKPLDVFSLADPDERIKPGAVVKFDMPGLEKDAQDKEAGYTVRVPDNYHPMKSTPLLVWFSGGRGGRNTGRATPIVDESEYLIACLPYPASEPRPLLATENGNGAKHLWAYHDPMLEDLKKRVPNISPEIRVVGGMSNGAHAIGMYLGESIKEFTEYFDAFLIVEGGATVEREYNHLRKKKVCLVYGDRDGGYGFKKGGMSNADYLSERLKNAKADVSHIVMEGVGHAFPAKYQEKCAEWIKGAFDDAEK